MKKNVEQLKHMVEEQVERTVAEMLTKFIPSHVNKVKDLSYEQQLAVGYALAIILPGGELSPTTEQELYDDIASISKGLAGSGRTYNLAWGTVDSGRMHRTCALGSVYAQEAIATITTDVKRFMKTNQKV